MVLASAIGKPVKVDMHTLQVARGHFAKVCMEIDLNGGEGGTLWIVV